MMSRPTRLPAHAVGQQLPSHLGRLLQARGRPPLLAERLRQMGKLVTIECV